MGSQCCSNHESEQSENLHYFIQNKDQIPKQKATLSDFNILKVLGRGGYGKILLVQHISSKQLFAMKVINKSDLFTENQKECTKNERNIMAYISHPFIVELKFAFQNKEKLFMVMEFMRGGEFYGHVQSSQNRTEEFARFYAAQITLALEHLHSLAVIYRDLKPENVLVDEKGNIKLTDFGLSKINSTKKEKSETLCGTYEYMAPEIFLNEPYSYTVDWYSLVRQAHSSTSSSPGSLLSIAQTRTKCSSTDSSSLSRCRSGSTMPPRACSRGCSTLTLRSDSELKEPPKSRNIHSSKMQTGIESSRRSTLHL